MKSLPRAAPGSMIGRDFFRRDPLVCAEELIGCELVWNGCVGRIVETEAYRALGDEAAHTFFRPSARRFVAENPPGTAYVYFNYGMYWLLNVLVKGGLHDGFVLIRAVEPICGIELMRQRRFPDFAEKPKPDKALCSGPGKLTIAMGINGQDHGRDLCAGEAVGFRMPAGPRISAVKDVRIGISKAADFEWRYLAAGNPFVSVPLTRRGSTDAKPPRAGHK